MNKSILKSYAPQARRDFIQAVTDRAGILGLSAQGNLPVEISGDLALINGRPFPKNVAESRRALENWIHAKGFGQVMEEVAYRWFNRCAALRYMELHDYLGHGLRVLSNPTGSAIPEILDRAADVDLPGLDRDEVIRLRLAGDQDAELYRLLLLAQCHALGRVMPVIFGDRDTETDLLLPDNLLQTGSPLRKLVDTIPEGDWQEIEIVGWLYQFYISEKKDQVIGKVVKSEDIPAATQLFTPNWIVKYMVQNTLGRKWLMTYPNSALRAKMEFYIEPARQEPEVQAQLDAITPRELHPEELTFCDPASGSGHILAEAYDLFKEIYLERGYRTKDIPRLILEKNLYGLDIDDRAAQLARFTVLMKARADDHRILDPDNPVRLNIVAFQEPNGLTTDTLAPVLLRTKVQTFAPSTQKQLPLIQPKAAKQPLTATTPPDVTRDELSGLLHIFQNAKTFGSLLTIPPTLHQALPRFRQLLDKAQTMDVEAQGYAARLRPLVHQAELLAKQYDFVVANPPYMGGKGLNPKLKAHLKDYYADVKSDLFSAFIVRNFLLSKPHAQLGFMSPFVWMFISSYEKLRTFLINKKSITTLIQLEYSGFDGATVPICTYTLANTPMPKLKGSYIRLSDFRGAENQAPKTLEAIRNKDCGWFYTASASDFMKIPGGPIAYWVSNGVRDSFQRQKAFSDFFFSDGLTKTGNNDKYLRFHWEVSHVNAFDEEKYRTCVKGGDARDYYGNTDVVVNWTPEARNHYRKDLVARITPEYLWQSSGISWTKISSKGPTFRWFGNGMIAETGGPAIFSKESTGDNIYWQALGFLASKVSWNILTTLNPTLNFQTNEVLSLPFNSQATAQAATRTIELRKISQTDWDSFETSRDFNSLPQLNPNYHQPTLKATYLNLRTHWREMTLEMQRLEEENNRIFIEVYGLQDELTPNVPLHEITLTCNPHYRYGPGKADEEYKALQRADTMRELISYAVGCMMGRYSLDEPGLIYAHSGGEGFEPSRYATFPADDDGIVPVMDEAWFEDDAATRFSEFLQVAWTPETLDENLQFVADSLDPKTGETPARTIRRYLCTRFFKDHLKTYKKRPIYWLFSSGRHRAFECLVYLHRYNANTLARMRSEYVTPLQGKFNARIEFLTREAEAPGSTTAKRQLQKELETMRKKQQELRAFDELLRHYADQRIALDLDDGVKVNYGKFGKLLAEVKAVTGGGVEEG